MEDNRSLLDRLNEKEEAAGLDKAEAKKDDIKEDKTSSTKSAKKKNTDNAEKVIWGACGFLGAIFLIMLIVFIICIIFECGYMKDTQKGILQVQKSNSHQQSF